MSCRGNPLWLPFAVKYLFICASVLTSFNWETLYLIQSPTTVKDASSTFNEDGEIWINASDEDISKNFTVLSERFPGPSLLLDYCGNLNQEQLSSFHIITRDGLMSAPGDLQTSFYLPKEDDTI